jgi:ribosomal protein S18 acetylase RimI-like enzyme
MKNMRYRQYQKRDFHALSALYRNFYNEMREWQGWSQVKLDEKEAEETARGSLDANSVIFVAEDNKKLIGFGRVQFWDGAYSIREVFVEKPFRRKGIGSKLLENCENLVQQNGETSVYLTVEPKHSVSIEYLIHNGYDTLNMLELRKDPARSNFPERQHNVDILGHRLRLLKRNI